MPSRLTGYFYAKKWAYRYSFNGQERDDEIAGAGNIMTAEFWEYDTRLGRRWNLDPIIFADVSPYVTFLNSPIILMDPYGAEPTPDGKAVNKEKAPGWILASNNYETTVTKDPNEVNGVIVSAPRVLNQGGSTNIERSFGSKFFHFLGSLDDAIHNENSTVSQTGQTIGRFITEFHPAVPIYDFGSKRGYWGNGNNFWGENQSNLSANAGLLASVPFGKLLLLGGIYIKFRSSLPYIGKTIDFANRYIKYERLGSKMTSVLILSNEKTVVRAFEQYAIEYVHKVYGASDNIRNALNKSKYGDVYEKVGKEMTEELDKMYRAIDDWMIKNVE
jgi:hypothetical protein